jgi:transglutaminase-like putative cysteine protease
MSIKASIYHLTHYKYDRPVVLGPQVIRLRPAPHSRTRVISHSLKVTPEGHFVNHQQDPFGNWLARFVFPEPVSELKIEVDLVADMTVYNPFDFFVEDSAETWPFAYAPDLAEELIPYRQVEPAGPMLQALLDGIPRDKTRTVDFVVNLNARIAADTAYTIRMEPGVQTPEETLTLRSASCRDSTWLLVNALRHLGFAARFVSGYLIQLKPDLKALDGPSARAGSGLTRHRACWRAKAISRWRRRRITGPARRFQAPPALPRSISTSICRSAAWPNIRASPSPSATMPGRISTAWAIRSMPRCATATCA